MFDYANLSEPISKTFESWAFNLPIEPVEKYGITPALISQYILRNLLMFIMVGFTLPLRSICWTLWYNNLNIIEEDAKRIVRKPSKKSSKNTQKTFKIEKREIDPEIIRRARLEDDEY